MSAATAGTVSDSRRRILQGGVAATLALALPACKRAPHTKRSQARLLEAPNSVGLHAVQLPHRSVRLTYMDRDEAGFIWASSGQGELNRYDPRTGELDTITHKFPPTIGHCVCAGGKVYMLGLNYPRLMYYDPARERFGEVNYPASPAAPDVWYGAEQIHGRIDGRHLYLFDRGSKRVIKWDSHSDTGKGIPYPYPTPSPYIGRYIPADGALWCNVWDFTGGQYVPLGLARLDLASDTFTGWYPFPRDDAGLEAYSEPEQTLYVQWTFRGKLMPFDWRRRHFCRFIDVPRHNELFGWIGMSSVHRGRWYFTLSTLAPSGTGFDGKPIHFLNALLEFDPRSGQLAFPTLDVPGAYYQVSYLLSADGEFYCTANNILRSDGQLDVGRRGELAFWQSVRPELLRSA